MSLVSGEALWVEGRGVRRVRQLPTVYAWVVRVWSERDRSRHRLSVYVCGDLDNKVTMLDAATKETMWEAELGDTVSSKA